MNTRYCARTGCGFANQYTSSKPRFCGSCGQPFDAVFASIPASTSVVQPTCVTPTAAPSLAPVRPVHPAARQRQQGASVQLAQGGNQEDQEYFDDSPADRDAAYAEGMAIAAQLDPASFGIGTAPKTTFRFGDLPNLRETATKMAEGSSAPKKRAPRAKKGAA